MTNWRPAALLSLAALATMLGAYLAGAPPGRIAVYGGALAAGWLLLGLRRLLPPLHAAWLLLVPMLIALPMLTGPEFEGASRWLPIGPVRLQPALILLPLLLDAPRSRLQAIAVLVSMIALIFQPDWGTFFALASALIILVPSERLRDRLMVAAALALLAVHLSTETATTVRFIENVLTDLQTFPLGSILAYGAALVLGAWALAEDHATSTSLQLFWGGALLASLIGPYPTPLLGLSASALLGLFLSLPAKDRATFKA
ncbi:hypothetical protein [Sphingomicrobium arenosum]|uniref:hypothetical protein n=1 Tax=Sphingomicrobium arenosum TaxID=2233861 RepID=UPI00224078F8|nr:hypothetical protein [Sphingomicrobium arenosum]